MMREGLIEIELARAFEVLAKIENRLMESNIKRNSYQTIILYG